LSASLQLNAQFDFDASLPPLNQDLMQHIDFGDMHGDEEVDELDSGNWYEKLHWWKEAKRVYTVDIHDAMEQLKHIQQDYENKKTTIVAKVEEAIKSLPVTIEAALGLINGHLTDIKTKREKMPEVQTDEQRMLISQIDEQEKALDLLKTDFEQLATVQSRLNEAVHDVFAKQVKECENYEEKALEYFEKIEKVLDDKKAHNYYDVVENSLENIKALIQYLIGPLAIYIDTMAGRAHTLIPKIKKQSDDLERQGIIVRVLTPQEKAEMEAAAKKREEERQRLLAAKKEQERWNAMPWWQKIFASIGLFFTTIWEYIVSAFSAIGKLFTSTKQVKPV